jgi:hypothetical protein
MQFHEERIGNESVEKNSRTLECRRDFTGRMEKIALMRSSEKKIVD